MASFSAAKANSWVRFSLPIGRLARMLAHVRQFAVDVHNQRIERVLETNVIVGAAQAPLAAELVKSNAAYRARLLIQLGQLFGGLADGHLVRQHRGHASGGRGLARRLGQVLPGVIFAKMQFLRFAAG